MTQVMPVELAIIALLNARSTWLALVGPNKVYSGSAPEGAEEPYAVLSSTSERDSAVFATTGMDQDKTIDFWSGEPGKEKCSAMYADAYDALNKKPLALASGRIVHGKLTLVTMFTDPQHPTEHAVANYSLVTRP